MPKFTLTSATIGWSSVEAKVPPNATKAALYPTRALSLPSKGNSSIHYGTLRVATEPKQALRNLHNLSGGSQEIVMKAPRSRNLHNLIGGPKNTNKFTKLSRVQRPKMSKALGTSTREKYSRTFTSTYHR
jgi:hypothetical protein